MLAEGVTLRTTADILWRGDVIVRGVPVADGRLVIASTEEVPERTDRLRLPLEHDGVQLDPATRDGAVRAEGHRLRLVSHVSTRDGLTSWDIPLGTYLIRSVKRDGAALAVECTGLLRAVKDHLRAVPGGVPRETTLAVLASRLLSEDRLEVWVHDGLPQRTAPAGMMWGEDRLDTLREIATAWPAVMRSTWDGRVGFFPVPPRTGQPEVRWHDGVGGTVVDGVLESARDEVFNHVIVPIKDGQDTVYVAERTIRTGRLATSTYGFRSKRVESEAVKSAAQADLVAMAELEKAYDLAATVPVEAMPDWRVEPGDRVEVRTHTGLVVWGTVTGLDLPLTATGGAARYDVGVTL